MQALLRDRVGKLLWLYSSCRNAYFGYVGSIAIMPEFRNMSNYGLICNSFNAGTTACYLDANNKMPGALFPVRCERIKYEGVAKRKWNDIT